MGILKTNKLHFITLACALFSGFTYGASKKNSEETVIKISEISDLVWAEGSYAQIHYHNSRLKKAGIVMLKMTKHIGSVESIAAGPTIMNTRAVWTAYTDLGSFVCGVEVGRSATVCAQVAGMSKADTLASLKNPPYKLEILNAMDQVEIGLQIKDLNDAIKGLKSEEKYKPFADGTAVPEINKWRIAHGYLGNDDKWNEYVGLDVSTLAEMAKTGDLRALNSLAVRAKEPESKNRLNVIAAEYGSTSAICSIGKAIERQVELSKLSYDAQKPYILKMLSYFELARLRGDYFASIAERRDLLVRYKGVTLSPDDEAQISLTAKSMYTDLQNRRSKLGLGDFDNSIPDVVKTYFELKGAQLDEEG